MSSVGIVLYPQLAYAHAVQLLVDVFLLLTPFALFSEVGFWSIVATGVLTTFYQVRYNREVHGEANTCDHPILYIIADSSVFFSMVQVLHTEVAK